MRKNYDLDVNANKIRSYFGKISYNPYGSDYYNNMKEDFIEYTMSCDAGEIIGCAKAILKELIFNGTAPANRNQVYSEYLAVYDIYKDIKASL